MHKKDYSNITQQLIARYCSGSSIRQIAKDFSLANNTVSSILRKNNIVIRPNYDASYHQRKYSLNEDFFHNIDSEEKSYWLGFFSADGHLVEQTGISINLQESDAEHLQKIAFSLGSDAKLDFIQKTRSVRIGFWSKKLSIDLYNLGFRHNKSETQTYPNIDKFLDKHFIRGLLDGDGNIRYYLRTRIRKNKKKIPVTYLTNTYIVRFSGTPSIISSVSSIINNETGLRQRTIDMSGLNFGSIKYEGRLQCLKLLKWLYEDSKVYLDRKYTIYTNIISDNK